VVCQHVTLRFVKPFDSTGNVKFPILLGVQQTVPDANKTVVAIIAKLDPDLVLEIAHEFEGAKLSTIWSNAVWDIDIACILDWG
jgi:hypothetical protein